MNDRARDGGADKVFGVWDQSMDALVTYRYVGCRSVLLDDLHAQGGLRLRSNLRTPCGPLTAPLAIAALDAWGNLLDRRHHLALTHVEVELFDDERDVDAVTVFASVTREARTQVFTEARLVAAGQPTRLIGIAAADWAILAPTPPGFEYRDPGDGVGDRNGLPHLWEVFHGTRLGTGAFTITPLDAEIGTDVLHHGPILVVGEAAAFDAAASAMDITDLAVEHSSTRIVAAGRRGPFTVDADVLHTGATVTCRVTVRDTGYDDRLVAVTIVRLRPSR